MGRGYLATVTGGDETRMERDNKRRRTLLIGAGAAVLAGVVIAGVAIATRERGPAPPPPASQGGLQVDIAEAPSLDPDRQLRCFVEGQYVGQATLAECARRNGVSAQSLDVGLDESGNLAAAPTASLAPPPIAPTEIAPSIEPLPPLDAADPSPPAAEGPQGECLRHAGGEWRQLSSGVSLNTCVQLLFAGRCERPGSAQYGRWGDTTLRLVPGRVEQSNDNRSFRTVVEQGRGCDLPPVR